MFTAVTPTTSLSLDDHFIKRPAATFFVTVEGGGMALSDKNGLMRRWGIHSFARCEIPSATSTVRPKSSASR